MSIYINGYEADPALMTGDDVIPFVELAGQRDTWTTVTRFNALLHTLPMSGGTANGVLYLNGSKVVTSGTDLVFNATGLGIGTSSPAYKLDVSGTSQFSGAIGVGTAPGSYGGQIDIYTNSNAANNGIWVRNDSVGSSAKAGIVLNASGNSWRMSMGSVANNSNALTWEKDLSGTATTLMTLDSSGNLGLGVTPSAWGVIGPALQVKQASLISESFDQLYLSANAFFDGSWKYMQSDIATQYYQASGAHVWRTAASGTAGNAISFTQAMTLDASGNLGIGTTSPKSNAGYATLTLNNAVNGGVLQFTQADTTIGQLFFDGNGGTLRSVSNDPLVFGTNNTERVQIKATGQLRFVPLAADPSGAEAGDVYYNSGTNKLRLYDGSTWVDLN